MKRNVRMRRDDGFVPCLLPPMKCFYIFRKSAQLPFYIVSMARSPSAHPVLIRIISSGSGPPPFLPMPTRPVRRAQGINSKTRRDSLRRTWFPQGQELQAWQDRGLAIRFVVGSSQQRNDHMYEALRQEVRDRGDILIMPAMVDSYDGAAGRRLERC